MAFPLSPTNGQTAVLNGINYTYNSAKGAWIRVASTITATSVLSITSSSQSTSTNTGALQVTGGVGIGGNLNVGNNIYFGGNLYQNGVLFTGAANTGSVSTSTTSTFTILNTTSSTSTTTGALVVRGGVGIGGDLYILGSIVDVKSGIAFGVQTTGTTSTFIISNATTSNSTTSGALVVTGGAGIGGNLNVGGTITSNGASVIPLGIQEFTATAGQTTFTITGGYTVGTVQVFANGVQLGNGDITASNGTTVVLSAPRRVNDIIRVISGGTSSGINNIRNFSIAMSVAMSM